MSVVEWKAPALLWNGNLADTGRPRILEIRNDEFIPSFLQAMLGADPTPYFQKHQIDADFDPAKPLTLYQPLHGCYYLVTASLVCRQLGLPDKAIQRAEEESVAFVIRRRVKGGEEAWIPDGEGGFWQPLKSDSVLTLAPGEERLPMHPVTVCPKPETPRSVFTDAVERDLHYGYIPAGNRKKYTETLARTRTAPLSTPEDVQQFFAETEAQIKDDLNITFSFRVSLFQQRVQRPWIRLIADGVSVGAPTSEAEQWLFALVELGDFLKNTLPTLWDAIEENSNASLAGSQPMIDLYDALEARIVRRNGVNRNVRQAVAELEPFFDLVRGQGNEPTASYSNGVGVTRVTTGYIDDLADLVEAVVGEEDQPMALPRGEDSELVRLINHQVQPEPVDDNGEGVEPQYHLRTVYVYDPECPPIVSQMPSQPFTLAKLMDPDAPARLVRLEAPSIKPKDLRKYARGVGIAMSPELHKLASCMDGDSMDAVIGNIESCDSNSGLSIQMVCTFSIQIIFLVAFIVMFIFLIILNFVFWWLAYLRICLPIPKRT